MVSIRNAAGKSRSSNSTVVWWWWWKIGSVVVLMAIFVVAVITSWTYYGLIVYQQHVNTNIKTTSVKTRTAETNEPPQHQSPPTCPYMSLNDLSTEERYPKAENAMRPHIVDPPSDTKVSLVCCHTSVGPWNIAVHHSWAPLGAQRFLDMVTVNYFSRPVPLMRCIANFLCQFGLAGPPVQEWHRNHNLRDDPQWLPAGPKYRIDTTRNVKRFQKGYFSYAGSGPDSRGDQLFVALAANGPLGGGSPWEGRWTDC